MPAIIASTNASTATASLIRRRQAGHAANAVAHPRAVTCQQTSENHAWPTHLQIDREMDATEQSRRHGDVDQRADNRPDQECRALTVFTGGAIQRQSAQQVADADDAAVKP